jgi:hypothetical protein
MPEIMNGKNVADFIDPDIAEKLDALEREEEKLQAEGFYDSEEDMVYILTCPPSCILTYAGSSLNPRMSAKRPRHKKRLPTRSTLKVSRSQRRIKLVFHGRLVFGRSANCRRN